tara:strand:+ start:385 stop:804 length:420 start_codon:yes stop_codon:yes gene_type:complete
MIKTKIDKVLSLIDNDKLLKLVENCILEAKVDYFEVFVEEYENTSYDIELECDFDCNMLSVLNNGKWEDKNMILDMKDILTHQWKWENLKLSDGSILVITEDEDFNIVINVLKDCELEDGIITYRHWALPVLNESISLN